MVWPTLGSRTAKEQNRTEQTTVPCLSALTEKILLNTLIDLTFNTTKVHVI